MLSAEGKGDATLSVKRQRKAKDHPGAPECSIKKGIKKRRQGKGGGGLGGNLFLLRHEAEICPEQRGKKGFPDEITAFRVELITKESHSGMPGGRAWGTEGVSGACGQEPLSSSTPRQASNG